MSRLFVPPYRDVLLGKPELRAELGSNQDSALLLQQQSWLQNQIRSVIQNPDAFDQVSLFPESAEYLDGLDSFSIISVEGKYFVVDEQGTPCYRLRRLLGYGAYADVFEAEDVVARQKVALKVLRNFDHIQFLREFHTEISVAECLHHPSLIRVLGKGKIAAQGGAQLPFVALEAASNDLYQLRGKLKGWPPEIIEAFCSAIILPSAEALQAFHDQIGATSDEAVHRDVTPGNLLIMPDGSTRLIDYGTVVYPGNRAIVSAAEGKSVRGTPLYMSPEAFKGLSYLCSASDYYSLGATIIRVFLDENVFGLDEECLLEKTIRNAVIRYVSDASFRAHRREVMDGKMESLGVGAAMRSWILDLVKVHPARRVPEGMKLGESCRQAVLQDG